jgi:hypothetical protein
LVSSSPAKAFHGELVPQDPNDRPASVLLEIIKAESVSAEHVHRQRKSQKKSLSRAEGSASKESTVEKTTSKRRGRPPKVKAK